MCIAHTQTHTVTHTHKSDIHEIIFFEASVELNDNEILSTCFYVYAKLLYLSHLPHTFSNLSISVPFSLCHSREAEDIFWKISVVVIPAARSSPTSFIPSSSHTPPGEPLQTKDASGIIESSFFKTLPLDFILTIRFDSSPWKETLPFPKASK